MRGVLADQSNVHRLKVFISYSRHDSSELAEELVTGLGLLGFDPFLDRHDIAAGEDWEARLAALIRAADTVVFVISPAAVQSERCAWEVDKAVELSKRIIPIVGQVVVDASVPAALKRLNYIYFSAGHSFTRSLGELGESLRVDLDWIREHTRLGELAARWRERNELAALLVRDDELAAAQAWMAARKSDAPEVTVAQHAFIAASADAEAARASRERQQLEDMAKAQAARAQALTEREVAVKRLSRRTTVGLIGAGGLLATAAGFAYWATQAEERFRQQQRRAEEAEQQSIEEAIRKESMRTDIEGQLAAYAAAPGQEADDGPLNGNSPYTSNILAELADRNTSLQAALSRAHLKVLSNSRVGQRPYLSTDLNGDIYLQRNPPARRRMAILVHDNRLPSGELLNVERDALAWQDFLEKRCGFTTLLVKNPSRADYRTALAKMRFAGGGPQGPLAPLFHRASLSQRPPRDTLLLFFYSGAGGYLRGANYLMASEGRTMTLDTIASTLMPLSEIQNDLRRQATASILILDTNFMDLEPPAKPAPPAPDKSPAVEPPDKPPMIDPTRL
jgi:hypothetical protein